MCSPKLGSGTVEPYRTETLSSRIQDAIVETRYAG